MFALFSATAAQAEVLTSDNFQIVDPVITIGGERATSANFTLLQSLGELAVGTSSATNFQVNAGFLAFPVVTAPVPSATAGDGEASVSWTAAAGFLGWTVSGYNVGQATVSGGPYSYTSVGDVTSATASGLSNGTTYYFVVRAEDFFGNSIATSSEVSATPAASAEEPAPKAGGGGPPGLIAPPAEAAPPAVVVPEVILPEEKRRSCLAMTDFTGDGLVDIADLSVFLYYVDKPYPVARTYDINGDSTLDIVDISVIFYCWKSR